MTQSTVIGFSSSTPNASPGRGLLPSHLNGTQWEDASGFCSLVATILKCRRCSLLVSDQDGPLRMIGEVGLPPGVARQVSIAIGERVAGMAAQTGEPWIISET